MDDGEIWEEHKEESKKRRWSNYESSLALLQKNGIEYKILNANVAHIRVGEYDFWGTTGKFIHMKTKEKGRGVFNLIKKVKGK